MSRFSMIYPWVLLVLHIFGTLSAEIVNFDFYEDSEINSCRAEKLSTSIRRNCSNGVEIESSRKKIYFCRCSLENSNTNSGKWKVSFFILKASRKIEIIRNFDFYHTKVVRVVPGNPFFRKIGQSVRVSLEETFNDSNTAHCYAYHNRKLMYNLSSTINDETVELYGKCGIQLLVTNATEGSWTIDHDYGFNRKTANFTLVVDRENYDSASLATLPEQMFGGNFEFYSVYNETIVVPIPKTPVNKWVSNNVRECIAIQKDKWYVFYPAMKNGPIEYRGSHVSCEFSIHNMTQEFFGKWTILTVYDKTQNGSSVKELGKIFNDVFFYYPIMYEKSLPPSSTSAKKNTKVHVLAPLIRTANANCRLIHISSKREYELIPNGQPTQGIQADNSSCGATIVVEEKRKGQWFIEQHYYNYTIDRSFFIIFMTKN